MINQKGQGFMEVIVAIGIMVMGIVAVLVLTSYNLTASDYAEKRLIASNLAREALEVVRNKRDSNWLAGNAWDTDFPFDPNIKSYYQLVSFTSSIGGGAYVLTDASAIDTCGDVCKLYVEASTFNHDDSGTFSGFNRVVEFQDICDETLGVDGGIIIKPINESCTDRDSRVGVVVTAKVQWRAGNGETRQVLIEDRIFDWR